MMLQMCIAIISALRDVGAAQIERMEGCNKMLNLAIPQRIVFVYARIVRIGYNVYLFSQD